MNSFVKKKLKKKKKKKKKKKSLVTWPIFASEQDQKHIINFVWPNKCVHYEVATLRYLVSVFVLADTSQLSTWHVFECGHAHITDEYR